ncbi:uncharacterized protein V1518DRAFT_415210 [Limtongia smithiae]|uniref:uncharacterized protein n=1 Tax=Limtongia smithiae TaxID=1125753 RepID=UPI0034CF6C86
MVYYYKPIKWVTGWFILSSIICLWDATYILFRPYSFPGGKLHFIWAPYAKYYEIDYVYGQLAYEDRDGFPAGQSTINLVEITLNMVYVLSMALSTTPSTRLNGAFAGLIGATSCFFKTVLYLLAEWYSDCKYVGHNSWFNLIFLYLVPSSPWVIVSFLSMLAIAKQLKAAILAPADKVKKDN